ncbi:hypothetical protein [Streptomyces hainanensis]|uniref:Uncharacterized protein n=1 Tax=Streptomyces hainanensis TaxID=402648 RepID=A0A4R4TD81_9ACTN|nr:hypothetical protein [Streptomyces hainanensis]TDC75277.1 hypothetical protein E1283_13005 [Streptomyces hainanensis]
MGIWTDTFFAPAAPALVDREVFGRLVVDLARERVVRTPWSLLAGTLCVNASLNWGSVSGEARWKRPPVGTVLRTEEYPEWLESDDEPPPWGDSYEEARLLATGEAILDVLPALRAAPYGREDVAVVFPRLDYGNKAVADHYWHEDHRTPLVAFALAGTQRRPLFANTTGDPDGGPTHPVRTCVVHTYKIAPDEPPPPLLAVLSRHLGPELVSGMNRG